MSDFVMWRTAQLRNIVLYMRVLRSLLLVPFVLCLTALTTFISYRLPSDPARLESNIFVAIPLFLLIIIPFLAYISLAGAVYHVTQVSLSYESRFAQAQPIDWGERKWDAFRTILREAGLTPERVAGYSLFSDDLNDLCVVQRPERLPSVLRSVNLRLKRLPGKVVIAISAGVGLFFAWRAETQQRRPADDPLLLWLIVLFAIPALIYLVPYAIRNLSKKRISLILPTAVRTLHRTNPHQAEAFFAHEISHIIHSDPLWGVLLGSFGSIAGGLAVIGPIMALTPAQRDDSLLFNFLFIGLLVASYVGYRFVTTGLRWHLLLLEMRADVYASRTEAHRNALCAFYDTRSFPRHFDKKRSRDKREALQDMIQRESLLRGEKPPALSPRRLGFLITLTALYLVISFFPLVCLWLGLLVPDRS